MLMLLGLPWLWDVMALFDICANALMIGDHTAGEKKVILQGPCLQLNVHHKLVLEKAVSVAPLGNDESSDDESEDDGESSQESESDIEEIVRSGN